MTEDSRILRVSGPAVPVRGNDIDTDRIIPARFVRELTFEGLGRHVFADDRAQRADGPDPHPLDRPEFARARVMLVNDNFGCGSSREHAPHAIKRWGTGIRAIVGESFAEIFFSNCVSIGVPCVTASAADVARLMDACEASPDVELVVDLEALAVTGAGEPVAVRMPEGSRQQFLAGRWDPLAELESAREEILARAERIPYLNGWRSAGA